MQKNFHKKLDNVFWQQCPSEICFNAPKATNKGNNHHWVKHTNVPRQFYNAFESESKVLSTLRCALCCSSLLRTLRREQSENWLQLPPRTDFPSIRLLLCLAFAFISMLWFSNSIGYFHRKISICWA